MEGMHSFAGSAKNFFLNGHLSPAQKRTVFLAGHRHKQLFGLVSFEFILRKEKHADAGTAIGDVVDIDLPAGLGEKGIS